MHNVSFIVDSERPFSCRSRHLCLVAWILCFLSLGTFVCRYPLLNVEDVNLASYLEEMHWITK